MGLLVAMYRPKDGVKVTIQCPHLVGCTNQGNIHGYLNSKFEFLYLEWIVNKNKQKSCVVVFFFFHPTYMNVGMQPQDHMSKTLNPTVTLIYGPHAQPRPSQGRVCRLEVDDVNPNNELFGVVPTVFKAMIKPPHPYPHHMLSLHWAPPPPHSLPDLLE